MCKCLKVSTNAYYHWLKHKDNKVVSTQKAILKQLIKKIFNDNRQVYGSTRIQKALEREGIYYCRSYIALLMKEMGLRSVLSKKFRVVTTDSNHRYPVAENVLGRTFSSQKLGEKWVSDITYISIKGKWNYVTTIMDLADRKIIAWTLSEDMATQNTVYKTWLLATRNRQISDQHIFHSDQGVQYASNQMSILLNEHSNITQSMSRKGNCWDNVVAESFFKTLKYECTNRYNFQTIEYAHRVIDGYIKWYNYKRLHSTLEYMTPAEMEMKLRMNKYKNVA